MTIPKLQLSAKQNSSFGMTACLFQPFGKGGPTGVADFRTTPPRPRYLQNIEYHVHRSAQAISRYCLFIYSIAQPIVGEY